MKLFRYAYKDAGTGEFVSKRYAVLNKKTTYRLRIWRWHRDF